MIPIIILILAATAVTIHAILTAPEGHETEEGFFGPTNGDERVCFDHATWAAWKARQ